MWSPIIGGDDGEMVKRWIWWRESKANCEGQSEADEWEDEVTAGVTGRADESTSKSETESLSALFKHVSCQASVDEGPENTIRDMVLAFIKDKVFPLKVELLKPHEQMERHITDLIKKSRTWQDSSTPEESPRDSPLGKTAAEVC
ncbi:hypothetical protein Droror1_Dr00023353 [Drosera rotundifolia]